MKRCSIHPKYKANRAPTNGCFECARLYLQLKGTRKPMAKPGATFRSDKDYRRNPKHKNKKLDE